MRGALRVLAEGSEELLGATPAAVGHRVVHGGARYREPVRVDDEVAAELERLVPLAPLHQPANLHAIAAARLEFPAAVQVACFDTAFHATLPEVAQRRAAPGRAAARRSAPLRLPRPLLRVRGVGTPGARSRPRRRPRDRGPPGQRREPLRAAGGRSVDTTLGFTALDGLCMGTRPGALDPGVVLHLFQDRGLSAAEVEDVLYRRSGLLGLSGLSNDMRVLLASDDARARLAVDYFVYRAAKEIGALAAVLGGLDGFVFTAGIGENCARDPPPDRRGLALAGGGARRGRQRPRRGPDLGGVEPGARARGADRRGARDRTPRVAAAGTDGVGPRSVT